LSLYDFGFYAKLSAMLFLFAVPDFFLACCFIEYFMHQT
jgi:hypothetical protein